MQSRLRLSLAALGALALTSSAPPTVATQPAVVYFTHTYRSGFVTVNPHGQRIRLSIVNGSNQTLTPTWALYKPSGSAWTTGQQVTAAGKQAAIESTVSSTIELRAVLSVTAPINYDPNLFPVTYEVVEQRSNGVHTIAHVPFTESESQSGTP